MPTKIKTQDWIQMKEAVIGYFQQFSNEFERMVIPQNADNFEIYYDECEIHPTFTKSPQYMKIEYDLSLCESSLRTLSVYLYPSVVRLEFSMKEKVV